MEKPLSLEEKREQVKREAYSRLVMAAWDSHESADRQEIRDTKLDVERKAKDRL